MVKRVIESEWRQLVKIKKRQDAVESRVKQLSRELEALNRVVDDYNRRRDKTLREDTASDPVDMEKCIETLTSYVRDPEDDGVSFLLQFQMTAQENECYNSVVASADHEDAKLPPEPEKK